MPSTFQKYRFDYLFILLIIMAGLVAVFFGLGQTPPAAFPWSDESDVASDAVASVRDGLQFHYPAQLAGGPVAIWLEAGWIALFGKGLTGLRVLNGLVNLTSALLLYLLVRQLPFNSHPDRQFPALSVNHWLALTAALLFAVSTWLLGLARIATPNWSLVPPLTTLTFYFFWLALKTNRRRYFVATGVGMGLVFYGYIPGYFVPLVPAIFLGLIRAGKEKYLSLPPARLYLLPFPIAFIVATPIFIFFALHPVAVMQRVVQLAHTNRISELDLMAQGLVDTLSTFGFLPNWLLQGRFEHVAFDPLVTVLFVAGLLIVIWRRREPVYLFLLVWWVVMIAPAFLSRSASTGFIFEVWRRGIGAQPVSFILAALAVVTTARWLQQATFLPFGSSNKTVQSLKSAHRPDPSPKQMRSASGKVDFYLSAGRAALLPILVTVAVMASASLSYWLYFGWWANSGVIPLFFAAGPVRLVEWMEAESQADTLFIFPVRPNVSPTTRPELFTVRYLYEGKGTIAFPLMDETTIDQEVAGLLNRQPAVVHLMLHDRITVDPKDYFEYVLSSHGDLVSRRNLPDFVATTYHMRPGEPIETGLEPADLALGEALRLAGQRIQPDELTAGQMIGVALRWTKADLQEVDYNVSLALYDRQDYKLVGVDKPLLSRGDYLTSRHWPSGAESILYYTLPIPLDTPPVPYTLRVIAYDAETGQRLPPVDGRADLSLTLADIELAPNPAAVDPATLAIAQPIDVDLPGGLRLVGVESSAAPTNHPGDRLRVTLLWQVTEPLPYDLGLVLTLTSPGGEPILLFEQAQPLIADYPTTAWPAGQVYRANYPVLLPAALATNDYLLALGLVDLETTETLAEQILAPISVEARPHVFEAPVLTNQLNVDFGQAIRLLGFEVEPLSPGQETGVRLQWQALREMSESYKIFLHLIDAAGQVAGQVDLLPQQGAVPTTGWVPGEIIQDELTLTAPPDLSPGLYQLVVGLYNEKTGERLMVGQSDQMVLNERIEIR